MAKPNKWTLLRKRVIWILILLLVPPFILFFSGTGQAPPGRRRGSAGTLFGIAVPWEAYERQEAWVRRKVTDRVSGLSSGLVDQLVQQQIWRELLLLAEAKRQRLRVDDQELAASICRIPAFQQDGRFRPDYYYGYLRATGMGPQDFEGFLRHDLLIERLVDSVKASVALSDEDVRAAYEAAHERLRGLLFFFDPSSHTEEAEAAMTEEELRAYYGAHLEEIRIPDEINVEYAGASREDLTRREPPSDEELNAFYAEHEAEFLREDGTLKPLDEVREEVRRRVMDQKTRKALTVLALDLDEDLRAQRSFEEIAQTRALARRASGPVPIGTPWLPEGLPPDETQAVETLPEGAMSGVIETGQGVYIARVTQRLAARLPPLDEVRAEIRDRLIRLRAQDAARKAAGTLRARLNERRSAGLRFEEAFLAVGADPARAVSFTRTGAIDPIGAVPAVNTAAFGAPLGELTEVLETPGGFVVIRPEERLPADASKFAEVKDSVRQETLTRHQDRRVEEWLKDLEARANIQKFVEPPSAAGQ
ncbi:MAG: peptidyl-prolyl cis-trans isomerase [Candidatus Omnitrophica bacterium]|nr:peptidyl-prolyl cis-trans isomerase [Candidatus Omnitrophota bacterium]MBI2496053.1 peptidyl-prolyl cis-trans isomerase [Candidatus Omnitrophota bacterium]MBI3083951.1 peptidyl-prolyl cis-trans isomerase [Candidatus Omnitrophota bacterium]